MREAKITVKSDTMSSGESQKMDLVSFGGYAEKNRVHYARYEESEMTGMEGSVTTIKWWDDQVTLIRHGSYSMQQEFKEGMTHRCMYHTPYMDIPIAVTTSRLNVERIPSGWRLELQYDLSYGEGDGETNRMKLEILVEPEAEKDGEN